MVGKKLGGVEAPQIRPLKMVDGDGDGDSTGLDAAEGGAGLLQQLNGFPRNHASEDQSIITKDNETVADGCVTDG